MTTPLLAESPTIRPSIADRRLHADAKLSLLAGNALKVKSDGLYVQAASRSWIGSMQRISSQTLTLTTQIDQAINWEVLSQAYTASGDTADLWTVSKPTELKMAEAGWWSIGCAVIIAVDTSTTDFSYELIAYRNADHRVSGQYSHNYSAVAVTIPVAVAFQTDGYFDQGDTLTWAIRLTAFGSHAAPSVTGTASWSKVSA